MNGSQPAGRWKHQPEGEANCFRSSNGPPKNKQGIFAESLPRGTGGCYTCAWNSRGRKAAVLRLGLPGIERGGGVHKTPLLIWQARNSGRDGDRTHARQTAFVGACLDFRFAAGYLTTRSPFPKPSRPRLRLALQPGSFFGHGLTRGNKVAARGPESKSDGAEPGAGLGPAHPGRDRTDQPTRGSTRDQPRVPLSTSAAPKGPS